MKPTPEIFNLFTYALDALIDRDFFDVVDHNRKSGHIPYYQWQDENSDFTEKLDMCFNEGATKCCIGFDFSDEWIMKIPYFDEYDEKDYCEIELSNYQKAVDDGFAQYFPETYLLSEFGGLSILIQERMCGGAEAEEIISEKFEKYVEDDFDIEDYENEEDYRYDISNCAEELEDSARVEALLGWVPDFVDWLYENHINDLHSGNWLMDRENNWKIIDFSGF